MKSDETAAFASETILNRMLPGMMKILLKRKDRFLKQPSESTFPLQPFCDFVVPLRNVMASWTALTIQPNSGGQRFSAKDERGHLACFEMIEYEKDSLYHGLVLQFAPSSLCQVQILRDDLCNELIVDDPGLLVKRMGMCGCGELL